MPVKVGDPATLAANQGQWKRWIPHHRAGVTAGHRRLCGLVALRTRGISLRVALLGGGQRGFDCIVRQAGLRN